MHLREPVCIHLAESNFEAELISHRLQDSGIAAHVVEDVAVTGYWSLGMVSQIHKPEVWVEREQAAAAAELIDRLDHHPQTPDSDAGVEERFCYQCGDSLTADTTRCEHCGAALNWNEAEPVPAASSPSAISRFRWLGTWKKPIALAYLAVSLLFILQADILQNLISRIAIWFGP